MPRSRRWASMSRRIWAGERPGRPVVEGRRARDERSFVRSRCEACGSGGARRGRRLVAFERLPDQLRLLDRLLGHRRRAGLDRAVGEEPAPAATAGRARPRRRSRARTLPSKTSSLSSQAKPSMTRIRARKAKIAGGDADDRAAQDLADFLGDLGLGELDLLADQASRCVRRRRRRARRPTCRRSGGGGGVGLGSASVAYSGGSSSKRRRQSDRRGPGGERCWRGRCWRRASRSRPVV